MLSQKFQEFHSFCKVYDEDTWRKQKVLEELAEGENVDQIELRYGKGNKEVVKVFFRFIFYVGRIPVFLRFANAVINVYKQIVIPAAAEQLTVHKVCIIFQMLKC